VFRYVMLNEVKRLLRACAGLKRKSRFFVVRLRRMTDDSKATGGVKNVQFRELKQL